MRCYRLFNRFFDPGSRRAWPKEDRVVKSLSKSILICIVVIVAAGFAFAQVAAPTSPKPKFTSINPPPCDFSDQFYADNGLVSAKTNPPSSSTPEIDTEPDGRFGNVINGVPVRQTGPPA